MSQATKDADYYRRERFLLGTDPDLEIFLEQMREITRKPLVVPAFAPLSSNVQHKGFLDALEQIGATHSQFMVAFEAKVPLHSIQAWGAYLKMNQRRGYVLSGVDVKDENTRERSAIRVGRWLFETRGRTT